MQETKIKNKTLAFLVLFAIAVSVFSAAFTIAKFDNIFSPEELSLTGFASSNRSGNVSISIDELVAISIVNGSDMDFGTCSPTIGANITVNSNNTKNTSRCSNNDTIAPMIVANVGNVPVNITMNTSDIGTVYPGGTFISATNSNISYAIVPTLDCSAINGNLPSPGFHALDNNTGYRFPVCHNLSVGTNVSFHIEIVLPPDATTGSSSTNITFIGCSVGGAC